MEVTLDRRPIVIALAGANGAGKSTLYHAHLKAAGLRFVNADVLARELRMGPKLETRYPRVLANLKTALREIPPVWVIDNDDLRSPYRLTAVYENGKPIQLYKSIPAWLASAQENSSETQ